MVVWWCGEGCLDGWVDMYCGSICTDEGGKKRYNRRGFIGDKQDYLTSRDDDIFLYHYDPVFPKSWMFPPIVLVYWSGAWIMKCSRLLMGAYLFFICATHSTWRMILCYHIVSRRKRQCYIVVVEWVEEEELIVNQVFVVWGTLGCCIGVRFNRLDLTPASRSTEDV